MIKILFIGFSVTEEKEGYIKRIREKIKKSDNSVIVDVKAIGGATFNLIPFLFGEFVKDNYDYIIFEIATCYRFCSSINEYLNILCEITENTKKYGATPCYINMFRRNIDYNEDILSTAIEYHAKINNFPFLNLVNEIKDDFFEQSLLRDGIHTNENGAELYANKIYDFIKLVLQVNQKRKNKLLIYASELLPIKSVDFFERGEFKTNYISINEGEIIDFQFSENVIVCGLFFIQGPCSGTITIEFPETGFFRNIHMFDEFCYYRRYSYQMLPEQNINVLRLFQCNKKPNVKLRKGEYNNQPRTGEVVGFLIKK